MGADIHVKIEVSLMNPRDRKHICAERWDWSQAVDVCYTHRNYEAFGILAGVRGDNCLIPPRGLPANASYSVKQEFTDWGHSYGWLDLEELIEVQAEMKRLKVKYSDIALWVAIMKHLERDDFVKTRLVFGFDS